MIFFDFEVFRYDWLVVLANANTQTFQTIINDVDALRRFYEKNKEEIWIGYNSRGYDQYILKGLLMDFDPYEISKFIIADDRKGWEYSSAFNKIQLYVFDIMTTMHGLKQIEGFMGNDIRETNVSFKTERKLTEPELKQVETYCRHDVEQTMEVFINRIDEFESHLSLLNAFKLPLKMITKTKPQLASIILDANREHRNDEFAITFPDTLRLSKYQHIVDWYNQPVNRNYNKSLKTNVAGVPHIFAWGGLHGAIENYFGEGIYLNIDVASYYPALMIEYDYLSRNVSDSSKYRQIRDERIRLKREKNPMQQPYKIVLNSTYGAMKDKYNALYDPRQANNVCVGGQLLLLDLIEKLEPYCQLIQSNTDGVIIKLQNDDVDFIKSVCSEWENRTRMVLEFEMFERICQKDVNNYIVLHADKTYKSKGAYVKKLDVLDNDLPIVNKALVNYFTQGMPVEETIRGCTNLMEFQKIVKVSNKYLHAMHGNKIISERVLRVFASRSMRDQGVFKQKTLDRIEKIANTPERCFIENGNVNNLPLPTKLDINWYIDVAKKRLNDFLVN
ncbi:DNA polymerase family B [Sporomusa ovata DSM 2662]|uniref:DNA polymerase n=1 Tax=Sporomusa ovata TaxID=2378 RepID=A0A0U1L5W8_9FIRM|nr:DNA polymerase elongation subunit family B [Sporomusa ovata]EQB24740.1 DNA polymerase elongation subunit family B [Sporomusa ovata DSM 2662]CQR75088.1 DNA polymerase [Sporomusa ovata]